MSKAKVLTAPDMLDGPEHGAVHGNPLELVGLKAAQARVLKAMDDDRGRKQYGAYAGTVTIDKKLIVDVGVFAIVREDEAHE